MSSTYSRGFIKRELSDTYDLDNIENFNTKKANDEIELIYKYIPTEAKPSTDTNPNQLADKAFVNSSIQTSTAYYRGKFDNWDVSKLTDVSNYKQDPYNNKKPLNNDYLVITDASGYTAETLEGTWRFKYTGTWDTSGINGWAPEYKVNDKPFTTVQMAAIDSGVTESKVSSYDNHISNTTTNPHNITKDTVGLSDVVNTGDTETPESGSNKKFTSGGAFVELAKKIDKTEGIKEFKLVDSEPTTKEEGVVYFIKEST